MAYEILPNHCSKNDCTWCRDRRARARAQSIADSIALAKPSTTLEAGWRAPIGPRRTQVEIPRMQEAVAYTSTPARQVWHMKERTVGHRKCPKRWLGR